jgi:protein disulfide-isomerase
VNAYAREAAEDPAALSSSSRAPTSDSSFMPGTPRGDENSFAAGTNDSARINAAAGTMPATEMKTAAVETPDAVAVDRSMEGALAATETPEPIGAGGDFAVSQTPSQTDQAIEAGASDKDLPPLGLDGYCGVTLIQEQKWVKGNPEFGCIHRGRLYLFASRECLELFQMTPDMFSPLLGGADPVSYHHTGQLVEGARRYGVFYGDEGEPSVIVLFENEANRDAFQTDPAKYVQEVRQAMSRVDRDVLLR